LVNTFNAAGAQERYKLAAADVRCVLVAVSVEEGKAAFVETVAALDALPIPF
jgi:hypothetical protein